MLRCRPVRRWLLLSLLCLLGACRDSAGSVPTTTAAEPVPTTATTIPEPTTTTALSFAVPAVIDLPYVQRVLEAIYHLDGEAARYVYARKLPDAEFNKRLEAIFGRQALEEAKQIMGENAAVGFVRFADPPADPIVRAIDIVQAGARCIVVRAMLDFRPYYKASRPAQPQSVIQLTRFEVLPHNPTGWGVVAAGTPDPGTNIRVCE